MMQVFSQQWFNTYQKALRLYANTIGRDRLQIETSKRIVGIQPHSVTWQEDKHGLKSTAFYPRSPIADALKMDLWPFWKTLHSIDMSFLAKKLSLNFGFDTLTKYPDAHTETNTVDGWVGREGITETLATIRAGAGTTVYDAETSAGVFLRAYTTTNQYQALYRAIVLFNTSALTASANISATTYKIKGTDLYTALGDPNFCLVTSDPASNTALAASDFQRTFGTTDLYTTPAAISTFTGNVTKSLSSAGLAVISKTGITKLGHVIGWDLTGGTTGLTWASNAYSGRNFYCAEASPGDANYIPVLIVTYTTGNVYKILVSGTWKTISSSKVLVGGAWKNVTAAKQLVGGVWKTLF